MKRLTFLFVAFILLSFTNGTSQKSTDSRDSLLSFYEKTRKDLLHSVEGLNAEQMNFKASAEKWSISQCLEHIILTEKALFTMTKDSLELPANPERRNEVTMTSEQLITGILDRSFQAKAPEGLQPEGKYVDPQKALKDFDAQRKEVLGFIKQANMENLENHVSDSPFGPINAYHSFLFIAGHTGRHTLQIAEIKADPAFPK